MQLSKPIAFIYSWTDKIKSALICGCLVALIMVLLQPFDTFQSEINFKVLKLSGYALVIIIPILITHIPERIYFKKKQQVWHIRNEIISTFFVIVLITITAYVYHGFTFSEAEFSESIFLQFSLNYSLPFIPILIPLFSYLRFKFGKTSIAKSGETMAYHIKGNNQKEKFEISSERFLYAKAQQNYVEIYFLDATKSVRKQVIRSTFSRVAKQLNKADQVHRSYIINLDYLDVIRGSSRKKTLKLKNVESEIPVGLKYFNILRKHLQNTQ